MSSETSDTHLIFCEEYIMPHPPSEHTRTTEILFSATLTCATLYWIYFLSYCGVHGFYFFSGFLIGSSVRNISWFDAVSPCAIGYGYFKWTFHIRGQKWYYIMNGVLYRMQTALALIFIYFTPSLKSFDFLGGSESRQIGLGVQYIYWMYVFSSCVSIHTF